MPFIYQVCSDSDIAAEKKGAQKNGWIKLAKENVEYPGVFAPLPDGYSFVRIHINSIDTLKDELAGK